MLPATHRPSPPEPVRAPAVAGASEATRSRDAIRLLGAGGALLTQALLLGQLARVEWAQEQDRLLRMLAVTLIGFACLLCLLLSGGALLLVLCWETAYRIPAVIGLVGLFGLGTGIAWRRFQALSALGDGSFAATQEELTADMAMLRGARP